MTISKYTNQQYSGDVPLKTGDRRFAQDRVRDFYFMMDHAGLLAQDYNYPDTKFIAYGGVVSKGSGDTLNITAGVGYAPFSVYIPDTWAAFPPAKVAADVAMMRIAWAQQTNLAIGSAVLNGASVNYVKAKYAETDSNTRTRAKAPGVYSYEVTPGYTFTVDTVSPTAYEICLASFVGVTSGTFTFSTSYRTGNYSMSNVGTELTADATLAVNTKYVINATSRLNLTLPASANVGARIIIQDKGYFGYKILQNASQQIFVMGKGTVPGSGSFGGFWSRTGLTTIVIECITTDTTWQVTQENDIWMMKGYCMGGFTTVVVNAIEGFYFSFETSKAITATLDASKCQGVGVSGFSKGYCMGGFTTVGVNAIEDLNFATESSATITATLDASKYWGTVVSSFSKGYMMGGVTGSRVNAIEDLNFATESSATITATLDASKSGGTGVSSFSKGYMMGGYTGSYVNVIANLNFADESSGVVTTATLNTSKYDGVGVSIFSKGYMIGGTTGSVLNVIEDLNFADESSVVIAATLDVSKASGTGVSSFSKGYFMGGYTTVSVNPIEDLNFAVESSSVISATLDAAKYSGAGVQGYIG